MKVVEKQLDSKARPEASRIRCDKLLLSLVLLLGSVFLAAPQPLLAKPALVKAGLNHYMRGEFNQAVPVLQKALKGKLGKLDKVKAFKFLGLSLYTMGKLSEAEESFKKCIDLDNNCFIRKEEALDEAVLPFFKSVREGGSPSLIPPSPNPAPATPSAPSTPVAATAPSTGPNGEASTRVIIQSNAPGASVLIDGILAGGAGTPLSSAEGTVEVEVVAKGYKSRNLKLAVSKGMLNTFQIDLTPESKVRSEKEVKEKKLVSAKKARKGKEDSLDGAEVDLKDDFGSFDRDPITIVRRETIETKPIPISFYHLLPLGSGQLYNGEYLLGIGFAAAQIYCVYSIYVASTNIDNATAELEAVTIRARTDPTFSASRLQDFKNETAVYLKNEEDTQTNFIFAAAGAYAFGVLHAILRRPDVPVKSSLLPSEEPGLKWSLERPAPKKLQLVLNWKF